MKKLFIQSLCPKSLKEVLKDVVNTKAIVDLIQDSIDSITEVKNELYYEKRIEALEGLVEAQQRVIAELSK